MEAKDTNMEVKDIYKTKRYLQNQKILMVAENT